VDPIKIVLTVSGIVSMGTVIHICTAIYFTGQISKQVDINTKVISEHTLKMEDIARRLAHIEGEHRVFHKVSLYQRESE
jgi:hypothetical protein